ncbi:MAG: PAS domain-containing sensor histidine kinase [Actinobacteria bacterium]|nr:PAS domain-containing sensor histidine kinase [Actinomycetota bacterium]
MDNQRSIPLKQRISPPYKDRRFWIIQGLVLVILAIHYAMDYHLILKGIPDFVAVALFVAPILYAALNFGFYGAVLTTSWAIAAIIPDVVEKAVAGSWVEVWAHIVEILILIMLAIFVSRRVEKEWAVTRSYEITEKRYRDLFEVNLSPILIIGEKEVVYEANPAAMALFWHPIKLRGTSLVGQSLTDILGLKGVRISTSTNNEQTFSFQKADGQEVELHPISSPMVDKDGNTLVQIIFHDITSQSRRRKQAQSYAAHVLQGQEDERRRIAQELHDETLQTLVQLMRKITAVQKAISSSTVDQPDGATRPDGATQSAILQQNIHDSRVLVEKTMNELRVIARGLRPPALEDLGLMVALRRLLEDVEERTKITITFESKGEEVKLSEQAEIILYRIVQEALSNIERHSLAHQVKVNFNFLNNSIEIQVIDDGIGFDAPGVLSSMYTLGLSGMTERAWLIGGELEINSQPGRGTVISLKVPLETIKEERK